MALNNPKTQIELSAVDKTKGAFDSVKSNLRGLMGQYAALGGVISLGGFALLIKNTIDAADATNDLSKRVGISVERIGAFQLAANQSGTSIDALAKALGKGSEYIVKNAKDLKGLGIEAKTSEELLFKVAGMVTKLTTDDPRRVTLAKAIFGKSGDELLPLLSEGEDGLRKMVERGQQLNPVTTELAENSDRFNDQLEELKLRSTGFGVALVTDTLPALNQIIEKMREATKEGGLLKGLLVGFGETFKVAMFGSDDENKRKRADFGIPAEIALLSNKLTNGNLSFTDRKSVELELQALANEQNNIKKQLGLTTDGDNSPASATDTKSLQSKIDKVLGNKDSKVEKISDYEKLTRSINEKIAAQEKEIDVGRNLTESEKLQAQISSQLADGTIKLTSAEYKRITQRVKKLADDELELSLIKSINDAQKDYLNTQNNLIDSVNQDAAELELQNQTFGKLPSAITEVTIARLNDKKAMLESLGLVVPELDSQIEAYQRLRAAQGNQEYLEKIHKIEEDRIKAEVEAFKNAEEEKRKDFEKTVDDINNIFREGFANLVNGGKGTWKSFTKSLFTTFKTAVADQIYKLFAQPLVVQLVAAISGVGVSGAANAASSLVAGGGSSGGGGFLGAGKSLYDAISGGNASIVSGIENLGSIIANGNGGIMDSIGGFIGQYSQTIADILPYAGAAIALLSGDIKGGIMQGVGVAIGSYFGGPIGGAIGGAIGSFVGGLIGGGGHAETYAQANNMVSASGNKFVSNNVLKGDGGGAGGYGVGIEYAKFLGDAIGSLTKTFGGTIDKAFTLGVSYSSKYKNINAFIDNGPARKGYGDVYFDLNKGMEQNAAAQAFFFAVKKGLVTLPNILTDVIKRSEITLANALDSVAQLQAIDAINQSLIDLPPIFKSIGESIKTIKLSDADALKARFSAINTYTGLFYTDAEKVDTFTKQLNTTYSKLNLTLPDTRDGFRSLVDGLDTTTDSGLGLFNSLIDLAPTMDAYYKALQSQADVTQQAADAAKQLAENLSTDQFMSLVDYTRAQNYIANGYSTVGIPGFASGGDFGGGLRIVGENGPELESTGPSRITNTNDLMQSLRKGPDNTELVSLLNQLINEVRAGNVSIAQATQKTAKVMETIGDQGVMLNETNNAGTRTILDTRTVP